MNPTDRPDTPSIVVEEGSKGSFAATTAASTRLDARDSLPLLVVSPTNHGSSPRRFLHCSSEGSFSPVERSRRHSLQWQGSSSSWQSIVEEGVDAGSSLVSADVPQLDAQVSGSSVPDGKGHLRSIGSELHGAGTCRPCAWFYKPVGCQNGSECRHCHLCPEGEVKARRRVKASQLRGRPVRGSEGAVLPGRILRVAEEDIDSNAAGLKGNITSESSSSSAPVHEQASRLQGATAADSEAPNSFTKDDCAAFCAPPGLQINRSKAPNESIGSSLHGSGHCRPCAWYYKSSGCANGDQCRHCHMCPEGEIKARRKAKLGAKSVVTMPMELNAVQECLAQEDPCAQASYQPGVDLPATSTSTSTSTSAAMRKAGFHLPFFGAEHLTTSTVPGVCTAPPATLLQHRSGGRRFGDPFAQQVRFPEVGSVAPCPCPCSGSSAAPDWDQHEVDRCFWTTQRPRRQQLEEEAMLTSLSAHSLWDAALHEMAPPSDCVPGAARSAAAKAAVVAAPREPSLQLTGSLTPSALYNSEAWRRGLALHVSGGVEDISDEPRHYCSWDASLQPSSM